MTKWITSAIALITSARIRTRTRVVAVVQARLPQPTRSEEHTSELQSHSDLHSFPTRPSSDLDDEVDNFGNRADYVSPYQNKNQGRGRRPGAPAAANGAAPAARAPSPGRQSGPRTGGTGTSTGTPPAKRSGPRNGAPRDGQARRDEQPRNRRPARDDQPARQEPAVRGPRDGQPQPKIMHKESKSDRFPSAEQLDQLPSRPRGEKPALLTRNREG